MGNTNRRSCGTPRWSRSSLSHWVGMALKTASPSCTATSPFTIRLRSVSIAQTLRSGGHFVQRRDYGQMMGARPIYDAIGHGYARHRRPDPAIVAMIDEEL